MAGLFTTRGAWNGGHYELYIELGERSDSRLRSALRELWSHPDLTGCFLNRDVEPPDQARLDPASAELPLEGQLYGIATLPNARQIASLTIAMRLENGPNCLACALPMASLGTAYSVGAYPFEGGLPPTWREPVDEWLCTLARFLFARVRFQLGLVGWEADDWIDAADIERDGIPQERWLGILWPEAGTLRWHPPNTGAPMTAG